MKTMKQKINWQNGIPTNDGNYVVTLEDGTIDTTFYSVFDGWEYKEMQVIAWFPIKNFEPYKK